jgi:prepilin-type N-terminal cleavage/methylation domain-containing protein
MNRSLSSRASQAGFSLIELMLSMSLFIIISGAAFSLLNMAQKQFQTEGQVLTSFQEGRLALDLIVRDINDSGYPAANQFSAVAPLVTSYAVTPVAWSPLSVNPCGIGACTSPGNFDLILEELNNTTNTVQWIHYQLVGTTLFRGSVDKGVGVDPLAATTAAGVMFPYATNVVNNTSAAQIAQINAAYPGTFPGGAPVPIFTYYCDPPPGAVAPTPLCTAAGAFNLATNVREVEVTLIIMTQQRDMQTQKLRLVTLNGRGHRVNPKQ